MFSFISGFGDHNGISFNFNNSKLIQAMVILKQLIGVYQPNKQSLIPVVLVKDELM